MRVKLFTLRFSPTLGGFDETPLRDFCRDKEILSVRDHFFAAEGVPYFTCLLTYQDAIVPAEALEAARAVPPRLPAPPRPRAPLRRACGQHRAASCPSPVATCR